MAKLSKKQKEEIIRRDLPGYRMAIAGHSDEIDALWAPPEASSPDLDALRKRYLGIDSQTANASEEAETPPDAGAAPGEEEPEDEIVPVEPEAESDPTDRRSHAKVAIVSGKDKKVVGTQG